MVAARFSSKLFLLISFGYIITCLFDKSLGQDVNDTPPSDDEYYEYYDDFYLDDDDGVEKINIYKLKKLAHDPGYEESGFNDDDYDFELEPIIERGVIMESYVECNPNSNLSKARSVCDLEGSFADKTDFQFSFAIGIEYKFIQPLVNSSDPSILTVKIVDFDYDLDLLNGQFRVSYQCLKSSPPVFVTVDFQIFDNKKISFTWLKECIVGGNIDVLLEYFDENQLEYFDFKDRDLISTAENVATSIYVSLKPPAERVSFEDPTISSNNSNIKAWLRGAIYGGELTQDYTELAVNYECLAEGTATITLNIPLIGFSPVQAQWTKDCSNYQPDKNEWLSQAADSTGLELLEIGTSEVASDIYIKGAVTERFRANFDALQKVVSPTAYTIPVEKSMAKFFIFYSGTPSSSKAPIVIDRISLTVGNPQVLNARIDESNYEYIGTEGAALLQGTLKSLAMRFICKKKGESNVAVTISVARSAPIEFSFAKTCRLPVRIKESGFLVTASSFLWIFAFLFLGVVGFALYRYRKNKANELQYSVVAHAPANPTGPHKV